MRSSFVLVGDDRMPFSVEAIEAAGLQPGARVTSMDVLEALIKAESAAFEARQSILRVQAAAWLKGQS